MFFEIPSIVQEQKITRLKFRNQYFPRLQIIKLSSSTFKVKIQKLRVNGISS